MIRFNLCVSVVAGAILLAVALPAQAALSFLEDFEGPPATGELDVLGWVNGSGSVGRTAGGTLPTIVAVAPAQNISPTKVLPAGMVDDLMVISADMYITGIYDTNGGDGVFGISDGTACCASWLTIGPHANPANPGYPGPGGGGWVLFDGLGGTYRNNITDGGGPGLGSRFLGIGSGELKVTMTIDQIADTVSVDIADIGGSSINPTWTMPLNATAKTSLQSVNSILLQWSDVHPGDLKEIDNISVESIPEPNSMLLFVVALGVMIVKRCRFS